MVCLLVLVGLLQPFQIFRITAEDDIIEVILLRLAFHEGNRVDDRIHNLIREAHSGILAFVRNGVHCSIKHTLDFSTDVLNRNAEAGSYGLNQFPVGFRLLLVQLDELFLCHVFRTCVCNLDHSVQGTDCIRNNSHVSSLHIVSLCDRPCISCDRNVVERIEVIHQTSGQSFDVLLNVGLVLVIISHGINQRLHNAGKDNSMGYHMSFL